ncbi:MAG TPA: ATP-grasp domain-containing protein [Methanolinea sp.]|nr:ATP-grasp domain-containing protein [Methanolinea sp.]HQK56760.1 ATP-grasp domain-containing protein [Methanolinea sp.]
MKKEFNVLILDMGSTTAISVAKGLYAQNDYDVHIFGADTHNSWEIAGSAFCHQFFTVPPAKTGKPYIKSILRIIKEKKIDLLIPIVDSELEILAKNRKYFENETSLLLSPEASISICNDKFLTYRFLTRQSIPTPKTWTDIEHEGHKYPVVIKPRFGLGSKGVHFVHSVQEKMAISGEEEKIMQEYCSGREYTVDIFAREGKLLAAVPRWRRETRAGISYSGKTCKNPTMVHYAEKIAKHLTLHGPANIQCFEQDSKIFVSEINPRFSAGLPLTTAAGVNIPLLCLRMVAGENIEYQESYENISMCRYWEEVFYEVN